MKKYETIVNPETGRNVSIYGSLGKSILNKYNNYVGGSNCANKIDQECPPGCERVNVKKGKRAGHSYCRKSRSKSSSEISSRSRSSRSFNHELREDLERGCSEYNGNERACRRRPKCSYTANGKCRNSTGRYNLEKRQQRLGVEKNRRGDRYTYASHLKGDCREYHGNPDECARSDECTYTRSGQCRKKRNTRKQPKLKRQSSHNRADTPRQNKKKQSKHRR